MRILLSLLSLAAGVALLVVGTVAITTFGTDGRLELRSPVVATNDNAHALVIDILNIEAGVPLAETVGETRISATSENFKTLFLGLADSAEANDYLDGVAYDVARVVDGEWVVVEVPGGIEPLVPKEETFWNRRSVGTNPSVEFTPSAGTTTMVVMNADATEGVDVELKITFTSSYMFPGAIVSLVLGGGLVLLAAWLFLARTRREKPKPETPSMPESVSS